MSFTSHPVRYKTWAELLYIRMLPNSGVFPLGRYVLIFLQRPKRCLWNFRVTFRRLTSSGWLQSLHESGVLEDMGKWWRPTRFYVKVGVFWVNDVTSHDKNSISRGTRPYPKKLGTWGHLNMMIHPWVHSDSSIAHSFFLDASLQHDGCVYFK